MMSRKNYVEFAKMYNEAIKSEQDNILQDNESSYGTIKNLIYQTSDIFKADNSSFDKGRFYAACVKGTVLEEVYE